MKRIVALMLMLALLLTFTACGSKDGKDDAGKKEQTIDVYESIDETVPSGGFYQVHSIVGVKNMLENPNGNFKILRDIDLEGAVLKSVGTAFTGMVQGGLYTISNFTLEPADNGNVGLFGELEGDVSDLTLANVTIASGSNSQKIGTIAASNNGWITGCKLTGTLRVENAAEDALCGGIVAENTGEIVNCEFGVEIEYSAPGTAQIGSICGSVQGGKVNNVVANGGLDITNGDGKTVGLLAGTAKDIDFVSAVYMGGVNAVDGKLFSNMVGVEENVTLTKCAWRDNSAEPLPEKEQALRDKVEQAMYDMGTQEWTVSQTLYHDCTCSLSGCHGAYSAGITFIGLPYNHKGGNLERFMYCQDENGVMKDWVYDQAAFDGFDAYIGNDCSTAILHAWWTVSNSVDFLRTRFQNPAYRGRELGVIPVGNWAHEEYLGTYNSKPYIEATGEEAVYESYAQVHKGDALFYNPEDVGGHTKMAASEPVIVRNMDGSINPDFSYILTSEQGAGEQYDAEANTITTWKLRSKMTFANLLYHEALPITCEELLTGEMEPVELTVENTVDGRMGMVTGIVKTNYYLNSVTLTVTDSKGNVTAEKVMFPSAGRYYDAASNDTLIRNFVNSFDLASFSTALQGTQYQMGETYDYTITASLATGDQLPVKEGSFTHGSV